MFFFLNPRCDKFSLSNNIPLCPLGSPLQSVDITRLQPLDTTQHGFNLSTQHNTASTSRHNTTSNERYTMKFAVNTCLTILFGSLLHASVRVDGLKRSDNVSYYNS